MLALFATQSFEAHDIIIVLLLVVLEGTLSIDNALVLGLLAKRLPPHLRKKALTYGLVGAFVFRVVAIGFAAWLLHWPIVKLLGGGYLVYVAVKHFFFTSREDEDERKAIKIGPDGHPVIDDENLPGPDDLSPEQREEEIAKRLPFPESLDPSRPHEQPAVALSAPGIKTGNGLQQYAKFWPTVVVIELTDVAFAVDSILAALAFIPPNPTPEHTNPKLWVVILGGFIGVMLMRVAAVIFIRLLDRFPRFEVAAYLLVTVIGLKLVIDWAGNKFLASAGNPHPVDFHNVSSPAFWAFWLAMAACFMIGFMGSKPKGETQPAN